MREIKIQHKESEFLTKKIERIDRMIYLLSTLTKLNIVKDYQSQRFSNSPTAYRIMVKTEHEVWT